MSYVIRTKHVMKLASMLGESMERIGNVDSMDEEKMGMVLIGDLLGNKEEQISEIVADIIGMSVEDFYEIPASESIDIMTEIMQSDEVKDFLEKFKRGISG